MNSIALAIPATSAALLAALICDGGARPPTKEMADNLLKKSAVFQELTGFFDRGKITLAVMASKSWEKRTLVLK